MIVNFSSVHVMVSQVKVCLNKALLITSVWLLVNNWFPQLDSKTPAQTQAEHQHRFAKFLIMRVTLKQS